MPASPQLGVAEETTYGTYVAPTVGVPFLTESLTSSLERLESQQFIAGRRVLTSGQWNGGKNTVAGDINMELTDRGLSLLFKHMFGAIATTGAGPYVHTATPGAIDGKSLTFQVGRNAVNGTVYPFSYTGCKITEWELACAAGEIATLALTVSGQAESTVQTLATLTYQSGMHPVKFNHGTLTIAGTPVDVTSAKVHGANNLQADRFFLGSQIAKEPKEGTALREYTWEAEAEFTDMALYNLYVAGTEAAFVLNFTVGANSLVIQGNARTDGSTPVVADRNIIKQALTGKFVASGATDDTAIKAVITDSVATP